MALVDYATPIVGDRDRAYGQGSLGGFINQVRRKPRAEFGASVTGQVGSRSA